MLFSTTFGLVSTLTLTCLSVQALPAELNKLDVLHGNVENDNMTWIGEIVRGGPHVTLTGTFGDVAAKLEGLQPYWMKDAQNGVVKRDTGSLEKRNTMTSFSCADPNLPISYIAAFQDGVDSIRARFGGQNCQTGPNSCGRFSCSHNSAILLCTTSSGTVTIPCNELADNAQWLVTTCEQDQYAGNSYLEAGQAFYSDNYNVILKQTNPGNGC